MRKVKFILPLLLCAVFCGCQSYSEIEDDLLVGGIAVDKAENEKYTVTAEIVGMGSSGESQSLQSQLLSSEGKTVFSALQDINSSTSKELFLSQASVLAISEEVAQEGLINIIDLIVRDDQQRITNDVVVAKGCLAAELFTPSETGEPIRSFEIKQMLENQSENVSITPEVNVYELINIVGSSGAAAVLPAISLEQKEEEPSLKVYGTAVFKNDKLEQFLDEADSKVMTILQGETKRGIISEEIKTDTEEYMTAEIFKCNTKIDHKEENGEITMKMNIKMDVGVNELTTKEDIMTDEGRKKLAGKLENRIKEDARRLIEKMQKESGADIFGFGERIYKENPKLWEKVKDENYFEKLKTDIKVKVNIRSTGFINKSPSSKDFRLKEEKS